MRPRAVVGPDAGARKPRRYASVRLAAEAHGVSSPTIITWSARGIDGWRYEDPGIAKALGGKRPCDDNWGDSERGALVSPAGILEPRPVAMDDPRRWM